jgi:molybdenum cofactor cytidylyltransferase
MGATLASGVRNLPDWTFALIALGDMPWILPQTFQTIASVARRDRIVVPLHNGAAGHPVAFGADFFAQLSRLDGDTGGRSVIDAYAEAVLELSVQDPGINADVDEARDLRDRNP